MATKRTLIRERDLARAGRDRVIEQRDEARSERDAALGNQKRMAQHLSEALDEADRLRKDLAPQPAPASPAANADLRRRLDLAERARASLDAQVLQLGQINERLTREAYDRAVATEVTR
jgi:hypothetical protein